MFAIAALCKAYRSLVSKRHPDKKNPSPNKSKSQVEDKFKYVDQAYKALNAKDQEGRAMNGGFHDFKNNNGDDPISPKRSFKNRSVDNSYFTSFPSPLSRSSSPNNSLSRNSSLSRIASRKNRGPMASAVSASGRLLRSMSRKNVDKNGGSGSDGGASSPEGGLLSRSLSRNDPTAGVRGGGGQLSRSSSVKGFSGPIMYSNSTGLMKPPAIERSLECTLEELCFGCIKRIMVTRDVVTNNGQIVQEEEMLTMKVKPGWRKGTKITFEGMGNETQVGTYPAAAADIIFVIAEKRHPLFGIVDGDDLELAVEIPLVEALTGGRTLSIPLLGGEKMSLAIDEIVEPGHKKIVAGQGMPKPKEQGNRGNLIVKFLVRFPTELTDQQRADVFGILQDSC